MPKFSIEKSITIDAPAGDAFSTVRNFRDWPKWSPWLIAEPACTLAYAENGDRYSWDGEIIGAGEMEITAEDALRSIDYQLTFLKPWKSMSAVRFAFAEREGGTTATWTMDGSLPFFMFWMKPMMTTLVGMDYQRGLNMLKDHIETGSRQSKLDFRGEEPFAGFRYVGVRTRCPISEIGKRMHSDLQRLRSYLDQHGATPVGEPFSIYHKWALGKGLCDYTLGFPVTTAPDDLPADFVSGNLPDCSVYSVEHTGPYRHLGNAWSAGVMHARAKVFRQDKSSPPFEIYRSDPATTPDTELVTSVHFPLK